MEVSQIIGIGKREEDNRSGANSILMPNINYLCVIPEVYVQTSVDTGRNGRLNSESLVSKFRSDGFLEAKKTHNFYQLRFLKSAIV